MNLESVLLLQPGVGTWRPRFYSHVCHRLPGPSSYIFVSQFPLGHNMDNTYPLYRA